jgi:hypothetical protein
MNVKSIEKYSCFCARHENIVKGWIIQLNYR